MKENNFENLSLETQYFMECAVLMQSKLEFWRAVAEVWISK